MSAALVCMRLGAATIVFTLLAGGLRLMRGALRARIGAAAVYALWLAVPIALALCCWPRHQVPVAASALTMLPVVPGAAAPVTQPAHAAGSDLARVVVWTWLAGAVAAGAVLLRRQHVFLSRLGPLRPGPDGTWLSMRPDAGPLLAGLLRPRIILPADFMRRYDALEQAAVLAHERLHECRGDLWWNALAAVIACLFWFHPLTRPARRCFLADQELACDSAVLAGGRHAPRSYANALLKTSTTASLPVGCTMQAISPLKERIMHLQDHVAPRRVRIAVAALLAGFSLAGAGLVWAATGEAVAAAGAGGQYRLAIDLSVDGGAAQHQEVVTAGSHHLAGLHDGEGRDCEVDLALVERPAGLVKVDMKVNCGGRVSNAIMMGEFGEQMAMGYGRNETRPDGTHVVVKGFRLSMRVDPA